MQVFEVRDRSSIFYLIDLHDIFLFLIDYNNYADQQRMSSWLLCDFGLFLIPKTPIIQDRYSPISPDMGRFK